VLDVDHHKVGAGAGRDPSEIIAAERAGAAASLVCSSNTL